MRIKGVYLFCLLIAISCKNKQEVAFKIGKVTIPKARFENMLYRYSSLDKNQVPYVNKTSRKDWIEQYIDSKYVLADALRNGYGKKDEYKIRCACIAKIVMCQYGGIYYNEKIKKNIHVTEEQMKDAYEKSLNQFYFQFLIFDHLKNLQKLYADSLPISTFKEYSKIRDLCINTGGQIVDEYLSYPFLNYIDITDTLWAMENNAVCGPLKSLYQGEEKFFFVRKIRKTPYKNPYSYSAMENIIVTSIKDIEERKLVKSQDSAILAKAKPIYNQNLLEVLVNDHNSLFNTRNIDKDSLKTILNKEAMNYSLNNRRLGITVLDLHTFITHLPVRCEITDEEDLEAILKEMVLEEYYWIDAQELGLTKTSDFIFREQERYEDLIVAKYLSDEVFADIEISDKEILQFTPENKEQFLKPLKVILDIFYFSDYELALKFEQDFYEYQMTKGDWIKSEKYGINNLVLNDTLFYDNLSFSNKVANYIKYSNINSSIIGLSGNSDYCVIVKRGEVDFQLDEDYLRNTVKASLINRKKQELYRLKLKDYKQRYNMKMYIDLKEYCN